MNILLWTLQILLALWNIIGGVYTFTNYAQLKGGALGNSLPQPAWMALALLQIIFALGLVVPGATGLMPNLTQFAAVYLALNALFGCAIFTQYSGFPGLLWGVIPALLCGFVAYGRWM